VGSHGSRVPNISKPAKHPIRHSWPVHMLVPTSPLHDQWSAPTCGRTPHPRPKRTWKLILVVPGGLGWFVRGWKTTISLYPIIEFYRVIIGFGLVLGRVWKNLPFVIGFIISHFRNPVIKQPYIPSWILETSPIFHKVSYLTGGARLLSHQLYDLFKDLGCSAAHRQGYGVTQPSPIWRDVTL